MKLQEAGENCIMRSSVMCTIHHILLIILRRMRWMGHAACMGEMRNSYKILVRKPEGKRPLGRPK
jgi:hypothetical protein